MIFHNNFNKNNIVFLHDIINISTLSYKILTYCKLKLSISIILARSIKPLVFELFFITLPLHTRIMKNIIKNFINYFLASNVLANY